MVSPLYIFGFAIIACVYGSPGRSIDELKNKLFTTPASNVLCGRGNQCVPIGSCNTKNHISTALIERKGTICMSNSEQCCDVRDIVTAKPAIFVSTIKLPNCGYRNTDFHVKVLNGTESNYIEFPWMVMILKKLKKNNIETRISGGSLIHPKVVLTSAHLLTGSDISRSVIIARAGDWDVSNENEMFDHQDSDVESIIFHEEFYKAGLWYDVALLFLKNAFIISDNVKPICLPPQDLSFDFNNCIVTGWGKNKYGKAGHNQDILKYIDVPIVSHQNCETSLKLTRRLNKNFKLHNSFICAGGEEGYDACQGDGGSPLICPISDKDGYYYQAGIVSWGIGCGTAGVPGVYVKVSKIKNWIDRKLNDKGLRIEN
ncbi:unnamed protein product [Diamesa serratosioi]